MLLLIKGAGDLASGIAVRLHRAGFSIIMTDLTSPTSIRRTVCFSEAIRHGSTTVEGITARFAVDPETALRIVQGGDIAVLADPDALCRFALHPEVVIDAILAKKNINTAITDAETVIAVGPGFTAGLDCHAVVETQRGHDLGRVITDGAATPNTGIPGNISGFTTERILRAPCDGIFTGKSRIGDIVQKGDTVATVDGHPVIALISGVVRGLLPDGTPVFCGMKSGDIDPRCEVRHCFTVSDKARAIGGGVLEAILMLRKEPLC